MTRRPTEHCDSDSGSGLKNNHKLQLEAISLRARGSKKKTQAIRVVGRTGTSQTVTAAGESVIIIIVVLNYALIVIGGSRGNRCCIASTSGACHRPLAARGKGWSGIGTMLKCA